MFILWIYFLFIKEERNLKKSWMKAFFLYFNVICYMLMNNDFD